MPGFLPEECPVSCWDFGPCIAAEVMFNIMGFALSSTRPLPGRQASCAGYCLSSESGRSLCGSASLGNGARFAKVATAFTVVGQQAVCAQRSGVRRWTS